MPQVLLESELDIVEEELDTELTVAEQRALAGLGKYQETTRVSDLTDGGEIAGATLFPIQNGERAKLGRPTVRRAWMWNGTESMLPLAWNTDGTEHDGARKYRLKRHCLCCGESGFRNNCKACAKKACGKCRSSADRSKVIPCFYLRQTDVPFPREYIAKFDCFLASCQRRGDEGFATMEEMRMHARTRHRNEYASFMETQAANRTDDIDYLKLQLANLMGQVGKQTNGTPPPVKRRTRTKKVS